VAAEDKLENTAWAITSLETKNGRKEGWIV